MAQPSARAGRIRTVLETLRDRLLQEVNDIEKVEFAFRPPDNEKGTKVLYLETMPFDVGVDSLGSTQRTAVFNIDMIGLIRNDDALVGVDFLWEVIQSLLTPESVEACTNAFGTTDGFSIEAISGCDAIPSSPNQATGFYSQIRAKITISMGADQ